MPKPIVKKQSKIQVKCLCPQCGYSCRKHREGRRKLRHLGNRETGRPVEIDFLFSVHRCPDCEKYFSIDLFDIAAPGSHYTHAVVELAIRVVVEDGLPYRKASWHLWRDHRVFVPFATIQNWVEAAGQRAVGSRQASPSMVRSALLRSVFRQILFPLEKQATNGSALAQRRGNAKRLDGRSSTIASSNA